MAEIDRFFTPAQLAVKSLAVPQAIPLPIDDLQNLVNRKQQNFDETETIGNNLLGLEVGAVPSDVDIRNQELSSIEDNFNTLVESSSGDLSEINSKAKQLALEAKRNLTRGKLGAIQNRYNQRQVFQEQLNELSIGKDAIISPNTARSFLTISDTLNKDLQNEQGSFNPYQALTPVKEINPVERGLELTKRVAEDGGGGFRIDKETGLIVTSSGERISRDKAFKATLQSLFKDNETINSIDQDLMLGTFSGGQINSQQLDGYIMSIANTLEDSNLRNNVASLIDLDDKSKFRAVQILKASDAVANQIAFDKTKITAKDTGDGFFDRINNVGVVQVKTQAVPIGVINSSSTEALNGIIKAINPEQLEKSAEQKGTDIANATDKFVKDYITRSGLDFYGKGVKNTIKETAKFIAGLIQPNQEIDRTSPDYLTVASNIPNFDQLPQNQQDLAVSKTIFERLDQQGDFNFSLDNSVKTKRDKNFILFGNPEGKRGEDSLLTGAFSSFTFTNPEGDILGAKDFREKLDTTPVTIVGTVTDIDAPVEYGSTILEIEGNQWFMSPSESTRNTEEWFKNSAARAKYSPTYRTSFSYKGKDYTFAYDAKTNKVIQQPN